jgi:hypothetical protein
METVIYHEGIQQDEDHLHDKDVSENNLKVSYLSNETMELVQFLDYDHLDTDEGDVFGDLESDPTLPIAPASIAPEPIAQASIAQVPPPPPAPPAALFINDESVKHFRSVKQIKPHMEARGFVVNTTDKLKDLKKLLVEYDSKVHNEVVVPVAPVAPVVLSSCWCNKPDNNDMVHCDAPQCLRKWLHFRCIGLTREQADNLPEPWMCFSCSE